MTQVTIISVGTLKEDYLTRAVAEYEKRLSTFCRVENINLKEERIANEDDPAAVRAALAAEGERIRARIPAGAFTLALCIEGKTPSSTELADIIGRAVDRGGKICFIIGSSHGLDPAVKAAANERLSLSRLTFPHQLARVLLLEATYRSFSILAGKRYHK
jgi:23S rRNA (pseudouridine1915-N3)-methyltransferase